MLQSSRTSLTSGHSILNGTYGAPSATGAPPTVAGSMGPNGGMGQAVGAGFKFYYSNAMQGSDSVQSSAQGSPSPMRNNASVSMLSVADLAPLSPRYQQGSGDGGDGWLLHG